MMVARPTGEGMSVTSVLVTGGAGFIGSNLVARALNDERIDRVVVVDDFSTGRRENLEGFDVEVIEASILDHEVLLSALQGIDAVVHLAAVPSVPRSIKD